MKRRLLWQGTLATALGAGVLGPAPARAATAPTTTAHGRTYTNPLYSGADPHLVKVGRHYYSARSDGANKLYMARSTSLLTRGESRLVHTFPPGAWNSALLWGPFELLRWNDGHFYLYYSAARDLGDFFESNRTHRVGVLRSVTDDPMGEWTDLGQVDTGDRWAIGPSSFEGFDGQRYLTWSGWPGTDDFPQVTYVARMTDPWTVGDRHEVSRPTEDWEGVPDNPLQEGQTVIRRGGRLVMLYSADASWRDDYCLGMLVFTRRPGDSPDAVLDADRWVKHPEPVFASTRRVRGPGGASVVRSPDGREDWLVYHAAKHVGSGWTRYVNAQRISFTADGLPRLGRPIPYYREATVPSGDRAPDRPHRYEAEHADRAQAPIRPSAGASGHEAVRLEPEASVLRFTVRAPHAAGEILLRLARRGTGPGAVSVAVDDGPARTVELPVVAEGAYFPLTVRAPLRPGRRVLELRSTAGGPVDVDFVQVWAEGDVDR